MKHLFTVVNIQLNYILTNYYYIFLKVSKIQYKHTKQLRVLDIYPNDKKTITMLTKK